jgi:hypothetical protein
MSDLIECQSDVAAYAQTFPSRFANAQFWLHEFRSASAAGKLAPLGDKTDLFEFLQSLVSGLNVSAHCPQLAPEHVGAAPDGAAPDGAAPDGAAQVNFIPVSHFFQV